MQPHPSGVHLPLGACRIGDQPLVRVSLHPPLEGSLQPGSTLAGTLDFSHAVPADGGQPGAGPTPRCMQVCRAAAGNRVAFSEPLAKWLFRVLVVA